MKFVKNQKNQFEFSFSFCLQISQFIITVKILQKSRKFSEVHGVPLIVVLIDVFISGLTSLFNVMSKLDVYDLPVVYLSTGRLVKVG